MNFVRFDTIYLQRRRAAQLPNLMVPAKFAAAVHKLCDKGDNYLLFEEALMVAQLPGAFWAK